MSYDGIIYDKQIHIPGSIPITEDSYPDPESLTAYFKKTVYLDESQMGKHKRLCFYGSDLITRVKINGKDVGSHRGGFDAFSFDVSEQMKKGENEILVVIEDKKIEDLKHEIIGKQDWYGNITGMWQPVDLEILEEIFIGSADFEIHQDDVSVQLTIHGAYEAIQYALSEKGKVLKEGNTKDSKMVILRDDLKCWSPDQPNRYDLNIEVIQNGSVMDKLEKSIGFREITQNNGKIYLNGEPFYMKGLLDQDYYPETDYVYPSPEFLLKELQRVKALGYNTIRYHVKTPPVEYVDLADELGLLMWIDLPYAKAFDEDSKGYLAQLRDDLMTRYAYSPSFCIMTLVNESWGLDLYSEEENRWLDDFWRESKHRVKDRLIVDNSACRDNHHVQSDINDYHFYFSYPENKQLWDKHIRDFAQHDFLPFNRQGVDGLTEKDPKELPMIVSEFGVWSLSDPALWVGEWMNYSVLGIKRIRDFIPETLKISGQNASAFFKGVQWQGYYALKHQIEQMRLHDTISGFVLTELSDIAWEANGILDYNRNDKPFTDYLKGLNQELLPIMDDNGTVFCSNITNRQVKGSLHITFNDKHLTSNDFVSQPMKTQRITDIEVPQEKGVLIIQMLVEGQIVSANSYELHIFDKESTDLKIFRAYNEEAEQAAEKGERVYIQLNSPQKTKGFEVIPTPEKVNPDSGLTWAGDWISGFYHYHPDMMGKLNYESGAEELLGTFTGFTILHSDEYESLIGKTLGWNLANCSYLIRKKIGEGEMIISTLDLIKTGKLHILS
ncbi:MAG: hypothetical protein U9N62_06955 [Thermotogota bacterium]|nr:hypothetical protein [Thermotogota bacterium]